VFLSTTHWRYWWRQVVSFITRCYARRPKSSLKMNRRMVGSRTSLHTLHETQKSDSILCVFIKLIDTHMSKTTFIYHKLLISLKRFGRFDSFYNKHLENTKRDYFSRTTAESSKLKQRGLSKWTFSMYYDDNIWLLEIRSPWQKAICKYATQMWLLSSNFKHAEKLWCIFHYPYQQMHNIHTLTQFCMLLVLPQFDSSASSSGSLNFLLC